MGKARDLDAEDFNEVLKKYGEMERLTEPQNNKGTKILNGNRFNIFAEGTDPNKIPARIEVKGMQFRLNFDGVKRFCNLCREVHTTRCPKKMKFDNLKEERASKMDTKIYGDSTVKLLEQRATTADVAATTGATLSHLIKAVAKDPHKKNNSVLVGGTNDIKIVEDSEFVFTIQKTKANLIKLAEDNRITVVTKDAQKNGTKEDAKLAYLIRELASIKEITTVITTFENDGTGHPTPKGAKALVDAIAQAVEGVSILDEELVVGRPYMGVQSLFRMGCKGCEDKTFRSDLCLTCSEKSQSAREEIEEFKKFVEGYMEENYPSTTNKRDREAGSSDDETTHTESKVKKSEKEGDRSNEQ